MKLWKEKNEQENNEGKFRLISLTTPSTFYHWIQLCVRAARVIETQYN